MHSATRPPLMRSLLQPLAAVALAGGPAVAHGQTAPRRAEQAHAWYQLFNEHRLDGRWALLSEAQFRRADLPGTTPQQFLVRGGLQRTLVAATGGGSAPATAAVGYLFQQSSVYGEAPAAAPTAEHRIWQQLQLAHRTGAVAWAHRFRAEQRWIEQTTSGNPYRFRQRARAFTRATIDAPALGVALPKAYVTPWAELFVTVGASAGGQVFDQSRLALQAGYRFTPRFRVEAGYLQQYVQRGGGAVTENNHTLVLSVFTTSGAR